MQFRRFSDNGFKKEIWRKATKELNKKFNVSVTLQQLKSHMADLKARYRIVKALREQSGFGWDDLMQICIADEDVWNRYIQAHPEAKAYRRTSFPLYDNLSIIYDGCTAEGKQQKSSRIPITQPCVEEQIPIQNCTTRAISQPPSNERVEESGSSSENVVIMTQKDNRSKHCSAVPKSLKRQKRGRTSVGERIADEISRMVTSSDRLCIVTPPTSTKDSYEIFLEELQKIEELDEDTIIEAVKFLRDR